MRATAFHSRALFAMLVFGMVGLAPFAPAWAQSLDLTLRDYGIAIGDSRVTHGIRLNFADRHLERVDGLNLTLWRGRNPERSRAYGLAVGLAGPELGMLRGVGVGLAGVGVEDN